MKAGLLVGLSSLLVRCLGEASSYSFSAATLLTGLLGSGVVGCDARLQAPLLVPVNELAKTRAKHYRGRNNYQYYCGGSLL